MEIKAVKTYENGFMTQAFAFGGEGGEYDASIKSNDSASFLSSRIFN